MDIDGLSESTLEKFIGKGWLRGFADIYRLDGHAQEIIGMEGFGEKSWKRLWDAIQRSRITTFERYLVAMDIPMIGRTASRVLGRYFNGSLDEFEAAVYDGFDFTTLDDFGTTLYRNIHEWFKNKENIQLWKELQKMVDVGKKGAPATADDIDNPFAGRMVVVTGTLINFTRSTINARLETLGAKSGSSVSKNTDYLICGENAGSKLEKARVLGITILSEEQFVSMAKGA